MLPAIPYFLAFIIWVPLACLVWLLAGVLALIRSTRRTGLSLALAMAGTFPGVFLLQIAVAPILVALVLGILVIAHAIDPGSSTGMHNPIAIILCIAVMIVALSTMLLASLVGFVEGWAIGWNCGKGRRLRDVVGARPLIRVLRRAVLALRRTFGSLSNRGMSRSPLKVDGDPGSRFTPR